MTDGSVIPDSDSKVKSDVPFDADFSLEKLPEDLSDYVEEDTLTTPPEKKKKVKLKDVHSKTVDAMIGKFDAWPEFHAKFHKIVDCQGNNQFLMEDENRVVRVVSPCLIEQEIQWYWNELLPLKGIWLPTMAAEDAVKTRKLWSQNCRPLEDEVTPMAWLNDPGLTYNRLDFGPDLLPEDFNFETDLPLFADIVGRMGNGQAVMAYYGSIMDPRSQCQQYLYIYGRGGEGKSAFVRAMQGIFKSASSSEQPPADRVDKFWTSGMVGKRVVNFLDLTKVSFLISGEFKSLTGEDSIRIERKGQQAFFTRLSCKFVFISNLKPPISLNNADMRRIIYCPIEPYFRTWDNYEEGLQAEAKLFLCYCWKVYKELTEGNPRATIPSDTIWAEDAASDTEEYFEAIFHRFFQFSSDNKKGLSTADISERLDRVKGYNVSFDRKFKMWLAEQGGVEKIRKRDEFGAQFTSYSGIIGRINSDSY